MLFCGNIKTTFAQNPINYITAGTHIGGYHIPCYGESTGILFANPDFGQAPYTFLWNTGDTTASIKDKPSGVYIVTMTDSLSVSHTDTFELRQPYELTYQTNISNFYGYQIGTNGGNNGNIELEPTGGTPPYRCLWNNGDSALRRTNLTAGNYSFIIKDANECTTNGSLTLSQPDPIQISFSNLQNLTCFNSNDGKATINITGGIGNYSVVWDNGSFSMSPDDLPAGFNVVRIFEQGNAIIDTGITLTQPNNIDIQFTKSNYNGFNVSCVDCFNGTVSSNVTGGTAPYTYQWDDVNNSTTNNLTNLNGGEYLLQVTDANGCNASSASALTMPTPKDWSRSGNANIDTSEFIGTTDTSSLKFKTNNQEVLRIAGNGNVGIGGVLNPTEKLQVNRIIKAQGLKLDNFDIAFRQANSANPEIITIGGSAAGPGFNHLDPIFPSTCIDPLNIERANEMNGGAVFKVKSIVQNSLLCKNADPTMYVGLYGCDGAIEVNQTENTGSQSFAENKLLINTLCGKDVIVGKTDVGNLIVNHHLGVGVSNPLEKFEVDGNGIIKGYLGIGNVTPIASLHIKDGTPNSLIIENTQSPNTFQIESSAGASRIKNSGSMYIYLNSNQNTSDNSSNFIIAKNSSFYGQTGGVELFKVLNDGTGYIKDLWVKAPAANGTFPDYVFAKDYKLKTLAEVKAFYQKHKHLPDMPSAKQIEAQGGVSMSDLLIRLTKIVEENTIYLTQQDEQIKQLQAENVLLKKAINKLTK